MTSARGHRQAPSYYVRFVSRKKTVETFHLFIQIQRFTLIQSLLTYIEKSLFFLCVETVRLLLGLVVWGRGLFDFFLVSRRRLFGGGVEVEAPEFRFLCHL